MNFHDFADGAHVRVRADGRRVADNAVGRAFDLRDFFRLNVDRKVFVDNADAAFLRERDRQTAFGNGVHRRANQRNVKRYALRQPGFHVDFGRNGRTVLRFQEHVVERYADFFQIVRVKHCFPLLVFLFVGRSFQTAVLRRASENRPRRRRLIAFVVGRSGEAAEPVPRLNF